MTDSHIKWLLISEIEKEYQKLTSKQNKEILENQYFVEKYCDYEKNSTELSYLAFLSMGTMYKHVVQCLWVQ